MEALAERMKALLGPFVLRRLKSEVASQLVLKQQRVRLGVCCCRTLWCELGRQPGSAQAAALPAWLLRNCCCGECLSLQCRPANVAQAVVLHAVSSHGCLKLHWTHRRHSTNKPVPPAGGASGDDGGAGKAVR